MESAPELFQLSVTNVDATVIGNIWMCSDCKIRRRKPIMTVSGANEYFSAEVSCIGNSPVR